LRIFKTISELPEFTKEFKNLKKRYSSLSADLDTFIKTQLNLFHKLGIDNKGVFQIPGLGFESPKIYKAKKFACKALKGRGVNSGIRIIYAYHKDLDKIEFIQIYFKADVQNEDRKRIRDHYYFAD
jgi:hypothetical protein